MNPDQHNIIQESLELLAKQAVDLTNNISFLQRLLRYPLGHHPQLLQAIVEAVAGYYHIPPSAIINRGRPSLINEARHVAFYLSHRITRFNHAHISKAFERTEKGVAYSLKSIQNRFDTEPSFATKVARMEATLRTTFQDHPDLRPIRP